MPQKKKNSADGNKVLQESQKKYYASKTVTTVLKYLNAHTEECSLLTKEDELTLREKYKDDMPTLKNKLIHHNIAAVLGLAKQWVNCKSGIDEIIQEGFKGLMIAADKFNYNQTETKFSTYAYMWIRKYMYDTYFKYHKRKCVLNESVSLSAPIKNNSSDDSGGDALSNYLFFHKDKNDGISRIQSGMYDVDTVVENHDMHIICNNLKDYIAENIKTGKMTESDYVIYEGIMSGSSLNELSSKIGKTVPATKKRRHYLLLKMKNYLNKTYHYKLQSISDIIGD